MQGKRRSELLDKVLQMFPPRLHRWLLSMWSEPAAWHSARLCFTRTAAVWSMVCSPPPHRPLLVFHSICDHAGPHFASNVPLCTSRGISSGSECALFAVWQVGHVVGLGDRHGENMLIDASSGDIVHVDFSCLFDRVGARPYKNSCSEGIGKPYCFGFFLRTHSLQGLSLCMPMA